MRELFMQISGGRTFWAERITVEMPLREHVCSKEAGGARGRLQEMKPKRHQGPGPEGPPLVTPRKDSVFQSEPDGSQMCLSTHQKLNAVPLNCPFEYGNWIHAAAPHCKGVSHRSQIMHRFLIVSSKWKGNIQQLSQRVFRPSRIHERTLRDTQTWVLKTLFLCTCCSYARRPKGP